MALGTANASISSEASPTGAVVTTAKQNGTAVQISQEVELDETTQTSQNQQNKQYTTLKNNIVSQQKNLCK